MPRPAITWLISDTHLYHDKCCNYCGRPADFTQQVIRNLKRMCAPQDTLIHLGDVIFYNYANLGDILNGIPGRKILTMGNHDKRNASWYMNHGFAFAAAAIVMDDIIFSHKPIKDFPTGVVYNVHGHLHNTGHRPQERWWDPGGMHRLFVLEHHYKPIELSKFMHDTAGHIYERDTTCDSENETDTVS